MLEQKDFDVLKNMTEPVMTKSGKALLFNRIQKNLEELSQYYRIVKLENDNTTLLLKMIDELYRRVEELERKTA